MKKIMLGLIALSSISAYADCISDLKGRILYEEKIMEYRFKLNDQMETAYNEKNYEQYKDLNKANNKFNEKVETLALQVCTGEI